MKKVCVCVCVYDELKKNEDNARSNVDVKINKRCRCGDVRSTVVEYALYNRHYKCSQFLENALQFDKE